MAEIARIIWEACGEDPEAFELKHLPTFAVDVQRRWPSVEKAKELLGWEAQIDARGRDRRDRALAARPERRGAGRRRRLRGARRVSGASPRAPARLLGARRMSGSPPRLPIARGR